MFLCTPGKKLTPGKKGEMKLSQRGFQKSLGIHRVLRANPLMTMIKQMSQTRPVIICTSTSLPCLLASQGTRQCNRTLDAVRPGWVSKHEMPLAPPFGRLRTDFDASGGTPEICICRFPGDDRRPDRLKQIPGRDTECWVRHHVPDFEFDSTIGSGNPPPAGSDG